MIAAWLLAGLALGALHAASLWWATHRLLTSAPLAAAMGVLQLRLLLLAGGLTLAATQGAAPLLATTLGVGLARAAALRRARAA